ncbi:MAG: PAS domain S-box protein, partial [Candidatus Omnitrophica bacterium]|nr:PAS domain S-box protein [Candidatus Omnitrophota bacterium]
YGLEHSDNNILGKVAADEALTPEEQKALRAIPGKIKQVFQEHRLGEAVDPAAARVIPLRALTESAFNSIMAVIKKGLAMFKGLWSKEEKRIAELMQRLCAEDFEGKLRALYGKSKEEALALDPRWARIGFDKNENRLGWSVANLEWLFAHPEEVEKTLQDAEAIRRNFKYVIFCGMGGSGLSIQVVKSTFGEKEVKIYTLRTTDPAVIADILDEITRLEGSLKEALVKALVIPISKSGKTEETVSHKKYFENLYTALNIDIKEHMWVITDKGSPMDTGAYTQREIQLNKRGDIGGRYTSPTTNIFLLPLALVSPERAWEILELAKKINDVKDTRKDAFLRLGAYLYYLAKEQGKDKLTLFVPEELRDLPLWFEQLLEESLGKQGRGVTLFYGEKLNREVLKPRAQNDRVFLRINLGAKKTEDPLWRHLTAGGYPVFEINMMNINEAGAVMLGLQRAVAAVGYLWDICFVDQPAVEGYKLATREVMSCLKPGERVEVPGGWRFATFKNLKLYYGPLLETGAVTEEELTAELKKCGGRIDDACAVYAAIIRILSGKPGFEAAEFTSYGRMTPGLRSVLEEARFNIFTRRHKMPSKLGEGPDKNHSYQQNIEDGKNMFFSTYFMPLKIEQPDPIAYDDNLIRAQAIGTVNSMIRNKRKVVLVTADSTTKETEATLAEFMKQVTEIRAASYSCMFVTDPQREDRLGELRVKFDLAQNRATPAAAASPEQEKALRFLESSNRISRHLLDDHDIAYSIEPIDILFTSQTARLGMVDHSQRLIIMHWSVVSRAPPLLATLTFAEELLHYCLPEQDDLVHFVINRHIFDTCPKAFSICLRDARREGLHAVFSESGLPRPPGAAAHLPQPPSPDSVDFATYKQVLEELEQEHAKLYAVVENLPVLFYVKNTRSEFVFANDVVAHLMGATRGEELLGKTDYDFFPRDLADKYFADEQKVISTMAPLINEREVTVDKRGNKRWIMTTKVPLFRDGLVTGIAGMGLDITAEAQAEEGMRLAAIGEMASSVAHEINNPASNIMSAIDIILERRRREEAVSNEELIEALRSIDREIARIAATTGRLLDFSRPTGANKVPSFVQNIISETLTLQAVMLEKAGVSLKVQFNDGWAAIMADRNRLKEACLNLIKNATLAMKDAAVRELAIRTERMMTPEHQEIVRVYFKDTGCGISEEASRRLGETFYSARKGHEGTGLGLVNVRKVAQEHSGKVTFESTAGEGATFIMEFPVLTLEEEVLQKEAMRVRANLYSSFWHDLNNDLTVVAFIEMIA